MSQTGQRPIVCRFLKSMRLQQSESADESGNAVLWERQPRIRIVSGGERYRPPAYHAKSPQTHGIYERFHKSVLRVTRRKKIYKHKSSQGRWCCGKAPMQTLLDSISLARRERRNQQRLIRGFNQRLSDQVLSYTSMVSLTLHVAPEPCLFEGFLVEAVELHLTVNRPHVNTATLCG